MQKNSQNTYVALLRGINVGGNKKVPMADLKKLLEKMGFADVKTLLNSGNIIFNGEKQPLQKLEKTLAAQLESTFGFSVPVLLRNAADIQNIISTDPFKDIDITKNIRLYVTFSKDTLQEIPDMPWVSEDGSFEILGTQDKAAFSVLDVSITKTTDSMIILEKFFGKDITTRNWNTLVKINGKLK